MEGGETDFNQKIALHSYCSIFDCICNLFVRTKCVHTKVVRACEGIILLSFSFFLLPSTYFSPRRGFPINLYVHYINNKLSISLSLRF